ncbi:glycosyltransferase family 4 protein [Umezakia ovalisporum]|uniref:Glycosyltransferase family 4 protein n=1 Tax=Umezakia ovalisporum FSS-62 TaxID=2971776 RepID=A0AA43GYK7_9CYAN|nr:glycosyltransferase family 4 protein [Umezakia ovalisporum]MDH6063500.1 glycosyltransferase family 4 protein [Umezakia ovalisporum FSS-62]MDH6066053.1 glycosyltransferase family 4 protein [Umezakia ovalisporum APH033B]MDH6075793.1 glycosyltransferase family 4 protein [Umezakia ovalisporum CS-1034]MDH6079070.1 glycosyltransferase family 4 protein [Umezakia ovalisporum FSS-45]MDH6102599.1 glycosyltransferase family 4 protein [Umezakia ovalisporum ANA283AFssAo]
MTQTKAADSEQLKQLVHPPISQGKLLEDNLIPKNQLISSGQNFDEKYQTIKIAQVAPPWFAVPPKDYGGTEAVISNLSEELVKQGHHVTLFASGDSQTTGKLRYYIDISLSQQKIPWTNCIEPEYHMISTFREIAHNQEKYDIIHTHLSSESDLIIFKLASQIKIPHICTIHSKFPFDKRKHNLGHGDKYYFSFAPHTPLIAISEEAKKNAIIDSKLPLNFIGIIPHGLSEYQFIQAEISPRKNLVWIGRITRDKGTKYAIEAAIKAKRKIILAGIVDTYLPESASYFYKEILPLIEEHRDYAEYIGPISNGEKVELLQKSYCFLNPIQWEEPFGLVMIEAMACGCPVISFNRGAAKELIKPGMNGYLATSVEEMVAKIALIANNINREQMVKNTWNNYSVSTMTKGYVLKYKEVINSVNW